LGLDSANTVSQRHRAPKHIYEEAPRTRRICAAEYLIGTQSRQEISSDRSWRQFLHDVFSIVKKTRRVPIDVFAYAMTESIILESRKMGAGQVVTWNPIRRLTFATGRLLLITRN
jgi:hypothetical protein